MSWIADTRFDFAALVLPLGEAGTIGVSFTSLGMEDMKVRTVELPEGTGEFFSANDIAVGHLVRTQAERPVRRRCHREVHAAEHLARIGQRVRTGYRDAVPDRPARRHS